MVGLLILILKLKDQLKIIILKYIIYIFINNVFNADSITKNNPLELLSIGLGKDKTIYNERKQIKTLLTILY